VAAHVTVHSKLCPLADGAKAKITATSARLVHHSLIVGDAKRDTKAAAAEFADAQHLIADAKKLQAFGQQAFRNQEVANVEAAKLLKQAENETEDAQAITVIAKAEEGLKVPLLDRDRLSALTEGGHVEGVAGAVLVTFFASWCPTCQVFTGVGKVGNASQVPIERLSRELAEEGGPRCVKFDADRLGVPAGFDVTNVPTVFYVTGTGSKWKYEGEPDDFDAIKKFALAGASHGDAWAKRRAASPAVRVAALQRRSEQPPSESTDARERNLEWLAEHPHGDDEATPWASPERGGVYYKGDMPSMMLRGTPAPKPAELSAPPAEAKPLIPDGSPIHRPTQPPPAPPLPPPTQPPPMPAPLPPHLQPKVSKKKPKAPTRRAGSPDKPGGHGSYRSWGSHPGFPRR